MIGETGEPEQRGADLMNARREGGEPNIPL